MIGYPSATRNRRAASHAEQLLRTMRRHPRRSSLRCDAAIWNRGKSGSARLALEKTLMTHCCQSPTDFAVVHNAHIC